jgi:hypothetical protein
MVTVDAVCPVHGLVKVQLGLPSGALIENCSTRCPLPSCGRQAEIVDGVYDIVGRVARTLIEAEATRQEIAKLRQVAAKARTGKLSPEDAARQAAAINPAFAKVGIIANKDPLAVWALIFVILTFFVTVYMARSADKAAAQAHEDSAKQRQATQSVEQVQQKIYDHLLRQSEAATAKAAAAAPSKSSRAQRPVAADRRRRGRRKAEKIARRKSRKKA